MRILDFRFWIDSTDKSGGLYHQEILGHNLIIDKEQFSFILAIIIGLVPQAIALYDKKRDRPSSMIKLNQSSESELA
ncbi:hypothetical protein C7B69_19590 [filamentous cyanobacterium Phorm 46]|nr:hypothetical protein C7B69_19590 [filamentous cyanobacterium Phorm 46]PSB52297.1 hypothetical protein C7B67_07685 [filamentous cyanobacterium Phorm 6]